MKFKKNSIILEKEDFGVSGDQTFKVTVNDSYWQRNYVFFNDELENLVECYIKTKKSIKKRKKRNNMWRRIKRYFRDLGFK